jgi:hypothetical protein
VPTVDLKRRLCRQTPPARPTTQPSTVSTSLACIQRGQPKSGEELGDSTFGSELARRQADIDGSNRRSFLIAYGNGKAADGFIKFSIDAEGRGTGHFV